MPRAGLTSDRVALQAELLANAGGMDGLSLSRIAETLGVRVPSLYKHIDGIESLRGILATRAKVALADELHTAASRHGEPLRLLARSYRSWAGSHRGTYPLTLRAPRAGDAGDEAASRRLVEIVSTALGTGVERSARSVDDIRFVRAALHGFVMLEESGAFGLPRDADASFDRLIDGLIVALRHPTDP